MFKISKERRICGIFKSNNFKKILKGWMKTTLPFKNISTDIYGPFSLDEYICPERKKTGYIFTITDIFSRFTKLYFLYNINSEAVINTIEKWIEVHGVPKVITADNGRQYISKQTQSYLKEKGINHILLQHTQQVKWYLRGIKQNHYVRSKY